MTVEDTYRLGTMEYDSGHYRQAADKLLPAADGGHCGAQFLVAEMYRRGEGLQQDSKRAIYYYSLAAEQGDPSSALELGLILHPSINSFPESINIVGTNLAKSAEYMQRALIGFCQRAANGDAKSMMMLGFMHRHGLGTAIDLRKAIDWYEKAYGEGYFFAANELCLLYYEAGDPMIRDHVEAKKWYDKGKRKNILKIRIKEFEADCEQKD